MTSIAFSRYQVGGALPQDVPSYVTRESDRQLLEALKAGEFCYVLNSRQMGKSSLMVRTFTQLQGLGWKGIILDFSAKDSQSDQPNLWYNGIVNQLNNQFKLLERKDFLKWLKERDFIAPVERLGEFIETVLLPGMTQPIVVFVDEIDSTLGLPFTDDFFALIRACYNKRAEKPDYKRLTFALLGVAAPSDLIGDTKRTPFNIGTSIDLSGFTLAEAKPLEEGLAEKSENPQAVLQAILHWTGGQPFLSQRLCQLVADSRDNLVAGSEAAVIEGLVRSHLIENWESQDQQSHLKTIRDRVIKNEQKAGYLLELYRQIRQASSLPVQNRPEEQELQLSGLVVKREGNLQLYNPIYAEVFNESWIDGELAKLRPYAESFRAWVISGKTDKSRLLRGDALKEAEQWAEAKNLSGEDRDFLSASNTQEREEEIAEKEREAELERERKDKEAVEKANKVLRKRTFIGTVIGTVILGAALIAAGLIANQAWQKVQQAEQKVQQADKKVKDLNSQLDSTKNELTSKQKELTNAEKDAAKKQTEAKLAGKAAKEANQKAQQAQKDLGVATQQLGVTTEANERLRQKAEDLQRKAEEAQQAKINAENDLKIAEADLAKTNQSLTAVRSLSQFAGELRKKVKVKESDEALRKAGLSTLIENEELKQAWLFAATAEAEAKDKPKEAQETIKKSLNSLKNSKVKLDQGIINQVSAFVYFIDGQLNNNNEQDYRAAYNALKNSQFDPYDLNTKSDILTEKDVELIHYQLIKSGKIDINSSDKVAKSFTDHLYKGLEFLLRKDRLQEADQKTTEIILYIARQREAGSFTQKSLENFSCKALKEIDDLWYKYHNSKEHFGFRVQKEIWETLGSPTPTLNPTSDSLKDEEDWRRFYIKVGWKTEESGVKSWEGLVQYDDLGGFRDLSRSKRGNLPTLWGEGMRGKLLSLWVPEVGLRNYSFLVLRTVNCKL